VTSLLREIAEEQPEGRNPDLFYSAGCLIGQVLSRAGVDIQMLVNQGYDGATVENVDWGSVGVILTDEASQLLEQAQVVADHGLTFAQVVERLELA
jgi:hypothetical protein